TDFIISHYDLTFDPNFSANSLAITIKADLQNLSAQGQPSVDIDLDTSAVRIEGLQVSLEGEDGSQTLPIATKQDPENGASFYYLVFPEPVSASACVGLTFEYTLKGHSSHSGFPLKNTGRGKDQRFASQPELYLISDFRWIPSVYLPIKIGQFRNTYKPHWTLKVKYPIEYVAVADGELVSREEAWDFYIDEWRSIVGGSPQLFIADYAVTLMQHGRFTVEVYTPRDDSIIRKAELLSPDIARVLELCFDLYGETGGHTYRLVSSHTDWGGHGAFMGQATYYQYLNSMSLKTIAHEIAHTWWGHTVSSYGEGSKFLREAFAEFTAAWALREIKGEEYFQNHIRDLKIAHFCRYPALDSTPGLSPLIIQEGYNPRSIVGANYRKGPLVVNQLRLEMGDEVFFAALKAFTSEFYDRNATFSDFTKVMNQHAERNLDSFFEHLCRGTGYPQYVLHSFSCSEKNGQFETHVIIENTGEFGLACPIRLQSDTQNHTDSFVVEGNTKTDITFVTDSKITNVSIDPEMTSFQYHPSQKFDLWRRFDESYFDGRNWLWYNKSYVYYCDGEYEKAVETLLKYINNYLALKNINSFDDLRSEPLYGCYFYSLAFYAYALGDVSNAEKYMRIAVPSLLDYLIDDGTRTIFNLAGFIKQSDGDELVFRVLEELTGKKFDSNGVRERQHHDKVAEWKNWWEREGERQGVNLEVLKRYAPEKKRG
ncbi:MAG: M1 family aminopeptidase, partial [bacterium]